jgi:hypothetical protein
LRDIRHVSGALVTAMDRVELESWLNVGRAAAEGASARKLDDVQVRLSIEVHERASFASGYKIALRRRQGWANPSNGIAGTDLPPHTRTVTRDALERHLSDDNLGVPRWHSVPFGSDIRCA